MTQPATQTDERRRPSPPRRFDRAEIIRATIVKSIEMRAHLSALIQHEKAIAYPSERWLLSLTGQLGRWRNRQERALRLDLRREWTPSERVDRDCDDQAVRGDEQILGYPDRPAWDEESAR